MFQHILIPTDLTERTTHALALAAEMVVRPGGRLTLLHVIETIQGVSFEELDTFFRALEKKAKMRMNDFAARLGQGFDVAQEVVYGKRAEEIVSFATERGIDLIVLSSHRVDPAHPGRDWGTISYKVSILSSCPVLLVK